MKLLVTYKDKMLTLKRVGGVSRVCTECFFKAPGNCENYAHICKMADREFSQGESEHILVEVSK